MPFYLVNSVSISIFALNQLSNNNNMKVYVVIESFGEYEDHSTGIIGVYDTLEKASDEVNKLSDFPPKNSDVYDRICDEMEEYMNANHDDYRDSSVIEREYFENNHKDLNYKEFRRYIYNLDWDFNWAWIEEYELE